jgi:hypothetical protein
MNMGVWKTRIPTAEIAGLDGVVGGRPFVVLSACIPPGMVFCPWGGGRQRLDQLFLREYPSGLQKWLPDRTYINSLDKFVWRAGYPMSCGEGQRPRARTRPTAKAAGRGAVFERPTTTCMASGTHKREKGIPQEPSLPPRITQVGG